MVPGSLGPSRSKQPRDYTNKDVHKLIGLTKPERTMNSRGLEMNVLFSPKSLGKRKPKPKCRKLLCRLYSLQVSRRNRLSSHLMLKLLLLKQL